MNLKKLEEIEDIIVQKTDGLFHSKRKKWSELPDANHRKVHLTEVVFDIDVEEMKEGQKIMNHISKMMESEMIGHTVWDTSRSFHIHSFFPEFKLYSEEIRKMIRKQILIRYSGDYRETIDFQKISEQVMIRLENGKHEITGLQKMCVYEYGNQELNKIPEIILNEVRNKLALLRKMDKPTPEKIENEWINADPLVRFCIDNEVPRGGRNQILFKNLAIGMYLSGLNKPDALKYAELIIKNCPGKKFPAFKGWIDKAYKGEMLNYNILELNKWIMTKRIQVPLYQKNLPQRKE